MIRNMDAILLMGGSGQRYGSSIPKQFHEIAGKKIYLHTLDRLVESGLFRQIVLVCHPNWVEVVQREAKETLVIAGGKSRQESSYLGIVSCQSDYVLIHDAVRPFVSQRILRENVQAVQKFQAVDTCIPSSDTLVHSKDGTQITDIPFRPHYLRGQTPQTFFRPLILQAHEHTQKKNASDDCSLVLELGHHVHIVQGEEENMKITTEYDLILAKLIYQ